MLFQKEKQLAPDMLNINLDKSWVPVYTNLSPGAVTAELWAGLLMFEALHFSKVKSWKCKNRDYFYNLHNTQMFLIIGDELGLVSTMMHEAAGGLELLNSLESFLSMVGKKKKKPIKGQISCCFPKVERYFMSKELYNDFRKMGV